MEYYGAIDQGTTSSRFIVFDNEGNIVEQHQEEFNQYFPNEYSVEHNPEEIWISVVNCINEVLKKIDSEKVKYGHSKQKVGKVLIEYVLKVELLSRIAKTPFEIIGE